MAPTVTAAAAAGVTVPPSVRTGTKDAVYIQPAPQATMSTSQRIPEHRESQLVRNDRPLRLRGGCVPCPVGASHLVPGYLCS